MFAFLVLQKCFQSHISIMFRDSYKYNNPIRNTIFNFSKLVSDLEIVKIQDMIINQPDI